MSLVTLKSSNLRTSDTNGGIDIRLAFWIIRRLMETIEIFSMFEEDIKRYVEH